MGGDPAGSRRRVKGRGKTGSKKVHVRCQPFLLLSQNTPSKHSSSFSTMLALRSCPALGLKVSYAHSRLCNTASSLPAHAQTPHICAPSDHPCCMQAGQRRTPAATPARSRAGALRVVAVRENKDWLSRFRQDYKDQTSIGTDFKRGAKQAQVRSTVAAAHCDRLQHTCCGLQHTAAVQSCICVWRRNALTAANPCCLS
jgi:hypothetical protein